MDKAAKYKRKTFIAGLTFLGVLVLLINASITILPWFAVLGILGLGVYFFIRKKTGKGSFYLNSYRKEVALILVLAFILSCFIGVCFESQGKDTASKIISTDKTVSALDTESIKAQADEDTKLTIHFLDVGQADSILIQLPGKKVMLVDAGNTADGQNVINYIKNLGINKIDYLIGTHPHEDHIGGMDSVINAFDVGDIYMPKVSVNTKTYWDLLTAIKNKGLSVKSAKSGVNILNGKDLKIDILAPIGENYDDLNNYSAVLKITYNKNSFLLTGDAEKISENEMIKKVTDLTADVLKAGHHGSDRSTSDAFLKKVAPKYAIISVGTDNEYGHPAQATLSRLSSAGINVLRTDELGTIIVQSDGVNLTIDKNASVIKSNAPPSGESVAGTAKTNSSVHRDSEVSVIGGGTAEDEPEDAMVYITKAGSKYHRDGCRYLNGSKIPISLSEAKEEGYTPCSRCSPPK